MALAFPDIDPVAFSLGPLPIRWYALAYIAGILIGWRYILHLTRLDTPPVVKKEDIDDFVFWAVAGVILGGRIGYILFYQFSLYIEHPLEVLKLWHGGMSFHGGASGVILAMIFYARKRKIPLFRLTDLVCCAVPIGLFFGRIANFINGELFGRVTASPFGMVFPHGGPDPRHASQLYEAVLEGLVLGVILYLMARSDRVRNRPGLISAVFLAGYALARFIVEFFREPDPQIGYIAGFLTMGQMLCLPMIAGGALVAFLALRKKHDAA